VPVSLILPVVTAAFLVSSQVFFFAILDYVLQHHGEMK
jgi:hypothetical protein